MSLQFGTVQTRRILAFQEEFDRVNRPDYMGRKDTLKRQFRHISGYYIVTIYWSALSKSLSEDDRKKEAYRQSLEGTSKSSKRWFRRGKRYGPTQRSYTVQWSPISLGRQRQFNGNGITELLVSTYFDSDMDDISKVFSPINILEDLTFRLVKGSELLVRSVLERLSPMSKTEAPKTISIPKMPPDLFREMVGRIKPIMRKTNDRGDFDGPTFHIEDPKHPDDVSYTWDPVYLKEAKGLEEIARFECLHRYGYYGMFKPSVGEVIRQIPAEHREAAQYFQITKQPEGAADFAKHQAAFDAGFHTSEVTLYRVSRG